LKKNKIEEKYYKVGLAELLEVPKTLTEFQRRFSKKEKIEQKKIRKNNAKAAKLHTLQGVKKLSEAPFHIERKKNHHYYRKSCRKARSPLRIFKPRTNAHLRFTGLYRIFTF